MTKVVHIQRRTYGRSVPRKRRAKGDRTADEVIGEAFRDPACSRHVSTPAIRMWSDGARTAAACRSELDNHLADKTATTRGGVKRRLHPQTHVLCSDIVSVPWTWEDIEVDKDLDRVTISFLRDAKRYIEGDIVARGGRVLQTVLHLDESHPHIHVLSVANDGPAKRLHPGHSAKTARRERLLTQNAEAQRQGRHDDILHPRDINDEADLEYRRAMSAFIDDFHAQCAEAHGFARHADVARQEPAKTKGWHEWREDQEIQIDVNRQKADSQLREVDQMREDLARERDAFDKQVLICEQDKSSAEAAIRNQLSEAAAQKALFEKRIQEVVELKGRMQERMARAEHAGVAKAKALFGEDRSELDENEIANIKKALVIVQASFEAVNPELSTHIDELASTFKVGLPTARRPRATSPPLGP